MVPCHTYEWAIYVPLLNASCQTNVEAVRAAILRGPVSHIWMSHVPHMNESCPTYECVMSSSHMCRRSLKLILRGPVSHVWMSDVTRMNESCPTYECVMSNICRHSLCSNSTCGPVSHVGMCHLWMRHVTLMNVWTDSHHINGWVMSHMQMRHACRRGSYTTSKLRGVTHMNESCATYISVL